MCVCVCVCVTSYRSSADSGRVSAVCVSGSDEAGSWRQWRRRSSLGPDTGTVSPLSGEKINQTSEDAPKEIWRWDHFKCVDLRCALL